VHRLSDPTTIAAAIDQMFASDLDCYRQALRARCMEFTWDRQAEIVVGLYDRLAGGGLHAGNRS
jgi:hypothetical protein